MNKVILLSLLIILQLFVYQSKVLSDELDDNSTTIQDDYDYKVIEGSNNTSKYVTPQEYENAIKTVEKYGLGYKKRKELEKKKKQQEKEDKRKANPVRPSPDALLRLSTPLKYNDINIEPGFYLLEHKFIDEKDVVIFKQANNNIATIPVSSSNKQANKITEANANIEDTKNNEITLILNTKDYQYKVLLQRNVPLVKSK